MLGETEPLRQELIGSVFGALNDDEQAQLSVLFGKLSVALDAQDASAN